MQSFYRNSRAPGRRRRSQPLPVGTLVEGVLSSPKLKERLLHEDVFRQWRKVVGGGLVDKCQPVRIKHHTLYIEVKSSAWAHQLIYMQEEIIKRVNELVGKLLIATIHCRAVRAKDPFSTGATPTLREKPYLEALVSEVEQEAWRRETETRVKDPELVEVLCRMRRHAVFRQRLAGLAP
ncbi:MAG: DUF721 domain-containing protein [Deltaproteobacteria bacterium]|nr:DUF721 domain-containing protein [Deltaproteobacteria bacterium]